MAKDKFLIAFNLIPLELNDLAFIYMISANLLLYNIFQTTNVIIITKKYKTIIYFHKVKCLKQLINVC